jgi:flavin reductase (DIM6/NTAB) family NADH-FMN oxidoreductase RutF
MKSFNTDNKDVEFDKIFRQISPEEVCDNVFTLAGKDPYLITAGKEGHYNSMVGSGGGFGRLFKKPASWCVIQSNRYTLELIEKEQTYTISYFPDECKQQVLFLGIKSGRDTEKMKETELKGIRMPSGNMSFSEARLIFECRLTQLTTPEPDDFCVQEARDHLNDIYKDARERRKYVFGEIIGIWVKK